MLLLALLLLFWSRQAGGLNCLLSAPILALFWLTLLLGGTEAAFLRRRAFIALYLSADGRLFRLLRPGLFILLWQALKALILLLLLFVAVLSFDDRQQGLLLADVLLLWLLGSGVARLLSGEARAGLADALARRWTHWLNTLLLWVGFISLLVISPPDGAASRVSWSEAVQIGAATPQVGCDALALLARMHAVAEALLQWSVGRLFPGAADAGQGILAWLLLAVFFGVSFLVTWTYSLALMGVASRPWNLRGKGDER